MKLAPLFAAGALCLCAGCTKNAAPAPASERHEASRQTLDSEIPLALDAMPEVGAAARCAVSGTVIAVASHTPHSEFQGKTYVFCCESCKRKFDADPAKALAGHVRLTKTTPPSSLELSKEAPRAFDGVPPAGTIARCAVTGDKFVVGPETVHSTYAGKTYVFCCASCQPKFEEDPAHYAGR